MKQAASTSPRRYLAAWFPCLPTDRQRLQDTACDAQADRPLVLVEKVKGALRLMAVDAAAQALGLGVGMALADARARTPDIRSLPAQPEADAALLKQVLLDFDRYSPMVALDEPHGLILDVTGCAHLFGGEAGLFRTVIARAGELGLNVRAAMAGTPQAARALARFGRGGIVTAGEDGPVVRRLPTAALELPPAELQALVRAGLKTVGQVDDRPRAAIAARFGKAAAEKLDRIMGREDVRITPFRTPAPCVVSHVLMEPISTEEDIHRVLGDLADLASARLERDGQGGRAFTATFFRVDRHSRRITVRTGRPCRDGAVIRRLFRERLGALSTPLDPGFGFDQLRLSVIRTEPLAATQTDFQKKPDRTADFDGLVDRLSARLGPEAVLSFQPHDTHIPERAVRLSPASGGHATAWPEGDPEPTPLRPLHLFDPPQPIETPMAFAPDGPPLRFRWRRVQHEVVRAEGPERIAGEWWRRDAPTRDYYRVEDRQGRRLWLFREGSYGGEAAPRWYLHGLFA